MRWVSFVIVMECATRAITVAAHAQAQGRMSVRSAWHSMCWEWMGGVCPALLIANHVLVLQCMAVMQI